MKVEIDGYVSGMETASWSGGKPAFVDVSVYTYDRCSALRMRADQAAQLKMGQAVRIVIDQPS